VRGTNSKVILVGQRYEPVRLDVPTGSPLNVEIDITRLNVIKSVRLDATDIPVIPHDITTELVIRESLGTVTTIDDALSREDADLILNFNLPVVDRHPEISLVSGKYQAECRGLCRFSLQHCRAAAHEDVRIKGRWTHVIGNALGCAIVSGLLVNIPVRQLPAPGLARVVSLAEALSEILAVQFKQRRSPERCANVCPESEVIVDRPVQADLIGGITEVTRSAFLGLVNTDFRVARRGTEFNVIEPGLSGEQWDSRFNVCGFRICFTKRPILTLTYALPPHIT